MNVALQCFDYSAYPILLRENSRYPLRKFELLAEGARSLGADVIEARAASREEVLLAHHPQYYEQLEEGTLSERAAREMGFIWSAALLERGRRIVGAMLQNIDAAEENGIAFTLGGGAHHSHWEFGKGFCVFNDLAVAALSLMLRDPDRRVAVLDCDVHQGDGTAALLKSHPNILTVSIHAEKNFPFRKVESDLDIGLEDGVGDKPYLHAVDEGLQYLKREQVDFLIYIAGADVLTEDRLGRMDVTLEGLRERDRRVFEAARTSDIPVSVCFGGGYCDPIEQTVAANLQTISLAQHLWS